jgi:uncharacterized protein (DUF2236 family)
MNQQEPVFGCEFTRSMWTDLDHILLIYVGSAAEFPLVAENHWLFYTDKLPSAPWDRFTSTFFWNRKIMLTSKREAPALAEKIRGFHDRVESQRSADEGGVQRISNQAFQAVGFMLIDYALAAQAYLNRRTVTESEKEAYYQDQRGFFEAMGIRELPATYAEYLPVREQQMREQLKRNAYTDPLFEAYRKDLGGFRYWIMCQFMACFVPEGLVKELGLKRSKLFGVAYRLFPWIRCRAVSKALHLMLLPGRVRKGLA